MRSSCLTPHFAFLAHRLCTGVVAGNLLDPGPQWGREQPWHGRAHDPGVADVAVPSYSCSASPSRQWCPRFVAGGARSRRDRRRSPAQVRRGRRAQRLAGRCSAAAPVVWARLGLRASGAIGVDGRRGRDVAYRRRGAGAAVSLSRGEALRLGPVALASVFAGVTRVELSLQLGTVSPAVMRIPSLIQQISTPAMAWCRIERCD